MNQNLGTKIVILPFLYFGDRYMTCIWYVRVKKYVCSLEWGIATKDLCSIKEQQETRKDTKYAAYPDIIDNKSKNQSQ